MLKQRIQELENQVLEEKELARRQVSELRARLEFEHEQKLQ
jgi:hypothetical protein